MLLGLFFFHFLIGFQHLVAGQSAFSKVIVPSVYREWEIERPSWTQLEMQSKHNYSIFLYQKINETEANYISTNRGTEAGVFLRYIVDHYDSFPDFAVFVHAAPETHSPTWLNMINCIRPEATYFNINNIRVCRNPMQWKQNGNSYAVWMEQCWRNVLRVIVGYGTSNGDREAFLKIFPNTRSIEVCATCCQQFIMSKRLVLERPLKVWKQLLQMIGIENTCHAGQQPDYASLYSTRVFKGAKVPPESVVGRDKNDHGQLFQGATMEHLSHVIFGQQPLIMPKNDMSVICSQFLDVNQCPGSPCIEKLIGVDISPSAFPTVSVEQNNQSEVINSYRSNFNHRLRSGQRKQRSTNSYSNKP